MLKKISIRKFSMSFAALFALLLIYLLPDNKDINLKESLEYKDENNMTAPVFLIDKNSFVALTETKVGEKDIEKKALELIKILTVGGMDSKLPSGFSAVIPPDTEVLNINFENNVLKVDFSKEILEIDKNLEEKMIESIVYTLTSIEKVDKIIIYVEGDILTKLPKTKINLPSTLDRSFGINKEFNLTSTKDITDVTLYYINQINENYYYVPVTKYLNDSRDKLSIIIEQLSIGIKPENKLISFMDDNTKVVSSIVDDNKMQLNIENNENNEEIKEKVNDTVVYSICDSYNLNEVSINKINKTC